ncbi:MAG TPA: PilZ domain-containing protein [Candidatus Omnitrophica bacterium]|nr:MAG: hypothetical protein DRP61_02400 [Candidatus Omnitrophota bacterium]RKY35708.1 MAG: hypothetical protein DRP69_00400 [Candidatus Omnitrophota bacterium]RKY43448.1 MAG: hypothetical protein DRP80_05260 [Candidatus Omnitrophota bacterium]HEC69300.1 PilZ domain-containing protein [Candidatus Omnitrophota bacterium]
MEERRKFIRFDIPLKAEVVIKANIDSLQEGVTKDFSREGLRLILHNFSLGEEADIKLKIYIPGRKEPVEVKGQVAWSRANDANWEVGIKIKEIDKEAKSEILDYVYKAWREKLNRPE